MFLLTICVYISIALATLSTQDVMILNESNFADEIETHSTILVEFYAPW